MEISASNLPFATLACPLAEAYAVLPLSRNDVTNIRQLIKFELELILVQFDVLRTTAVKQIQELRVMALQCSLISVTNTKHNDVICNSFNSIKPFDGFIKLTLKFFWNRCYAKGHR